MKVSLYVRDILQISEVDSLLEVSFSLTMEWFDARLTFTNLKDNPDLNRLTSNEKEMIWKPTIEFTNTKKFHRTKVDDDVVAKIFKYGNRTENKGEKLVYNTHFYNGKENSAHFTR